MPRQAKPSRPTETTLTITKSKVEAKPTGPKTEAKPTEPKAEAKPTEPKAKAEKPKRKGRFVKGSSEAKEYMATLRQKQCDKTDKEKSQFQ